MGDAEIGHHDRFLGSEAEAMVALVLADAVLEKFGCDSVAETARNHRAYLDNLTVRVADR